MARTSDVFINGDVNSKVQEVQSWLKSRGVLDFDPVSIFVDITIFTFLIVQL